MNRLISKTISLVATLALVGVVSMANERGDIRMLPVPTGASSVIQEMLMERPIQNVKPNKALIPQTKEEWKSWVLYNNARASLSAQDLAKSSHVSIKKETMDGVGVYYVTPVETDPKHQGRLFVFLHGGAYVLGGGEAGLGEAIMIAARTKMPVLSIDYRMPPDYPAPAAIDDVVTVWKQLLKSHTSLSMALGGSSSGGGLSLASVLRFKELKLDLPGALYLGTPGVDVDKIGDSRYLNEGADRLLTSWDGVPYEAFALYAGSYDHKHPYVSPIYGDFKGFPPSYLISGTRDLLLSDTVRAHRKLRTAGVDADLNVYEGLSHREYIVVSDSPESLEHFAELNAFLLKHLEK